MLNLKSTGYFQKTYVISFIKTLPKFKLKSCLRLLIVRSLRTHSWMKKPKRKLNLNTGNFRRSYKSTKHKSTLQIRRWNSWSNWWLKKKNSSRKLLIKWKKIWGSKKYPSIVLCKTNLTNLKLQSHNWSKNIRRRSSNLKSKINKKLKRPGGSCKLNSIKHLKTKRTNLKLLC